MVADGGVVVPLNTDAWRRALIEVRERRHELVALGHARAEVFTSVKSAHDLVECYDRALT